MAYSPLDQIISFECAVPRPRGVSVILPTYKGAQRIGRALSSLAQQTELPKYFEVVIVSNGPQDGTEEVVKAFSKLHQALTIRFERSDTPSASKARNLGLEVASFQYCTFLDDDDYISPDFLEVLLRDANPNRIVFAHITDFDEDGHRPSPISTQVALAVEQAGSQSIDDPFKVRSILSMTCAKLAPTEILAQHRFEAMLRSGEDVVFWTAVIAKNKLELWAPRNIGAATYYREIREGSVSRKTDDYSFSVVDRLKVIERVQRIHRSVEADVSRTLAEFFSSKYSGQLSFTIRYLKKNPDRYEDFLRACASLDIPNDTIRIVNRALADTLVISHCFPPYNDTSAIVMMKRILGWKKPVHVISNNMKGSREISPGLRNAVDPRIATHRQLNTRVSFSRGPAMIAFAEQALKAYKAFSEDTAPSQLYSRAMWPASSFAASLIKLHRPEIRWTAEFSDPLALDVHGNERSGDMPEDWLERTGVRATIADIAPELASFRQVFRLAELLPYALADEIVFTNEHQRDYMLAQDWVQPVRDRVKAISIVAPHPTPAERFYSWTPPKLRVERDCLNIGFFGSFYATRGLREVLVAMKAVGRTTQDAKIKLHVVSSDSRALVEEIKALDVVDQVVIHEALEYFECLSSFSQMDYLLVNDAATVGIKPVNPYLPSKLSDYLGAGRPIWALVEPGSSMACVELPPGSVRSTLGDEDDYRHALVAMICVVNECPSDIAC